MRGFAWFFTRSCRACDCSHVDLVSDETCCSKRKCSKLDCGCETSWIGYVMGLFHIFPCALAESIYEISACIFSVKSEIISEIYDPAFRLDVMSVDELTGYTMSETKENHVRIVQLCAEAEVCLSDKVSMYFSYRCSGFGSGRCCNHFNIRMIEQNP